VVAGLAPLEAAIRGPGVSSMQNDEMEWPEEWTIAGSFRRGGGAGPLVESCDGSVQIIYEREGLIAMRFDGAELVTGVAISAIDNRWTVVLVRHTASQLSLQLDGHDLHTWPVRSAKRPLGMRIMRDLDADAHEWMVYANAVSEEDGTKLCSDLQRDKDAWIQFRRGDSPRFRKP
jgi:hypothetical protein